VQQLEQVLLRHNPYWRNQASDKTGAYATGTPTSPEDLAATIYHALGIDPESQLKMLDGRPVLIVDGGRPLHQLFG